MAENVGNFLYWAATIVACLIVLLDISSFFESYSKGNPVIPIAGLVFAIIVWLIGRGCRLVLAGR